MTGAFNRARLPGWETYADTHGIRLLGSGRWRSALCDFHPDTTPSLRVNTQSRGWCCMACVTKVGEEG